MEKYSNVRIGVLGDGQLAMLIAQSAKRFKCKIVIYSTDKSSPAISYADEVIFGNDYKDLDSLERFFNNSDKIILENEFVSSDILMTLEEKTDVQVFPNTFDYKRLETKVLQRLFFKECEVPCIEYVKLESVNDIPKTQSFPVMLKKSYGGYDGYGNIIVKNSVELIKICNDFFKANSKGELLLEPLLEIEREFAGLLAIGKSIEVFEPCETIQVDSVCHLVKKLDDLKVEKKVKLILEKISLKLFGPGLYVFEFFLLKDGRVLVNEAAPRVHNSYHFSMDTSEHGQFETIVKIALGINIKNDIRDENFFMINLLGKSDKNDSYELKIPKISEDITQRIHLYGKKECRIGRKMGHITLMSESPGLEKSAMKIYKEYYL